MSSTHAAAFLPPAFHENLDAATLLTDDIVPQVLTTAADHAETLADTGNRIADACYMGASLMYKKAAANLGTIKRLHTTDRYAEYTDYVLALISVADDLVTRAGGDFAMAVRLGHLASPLGEHAKANA